MIDFIVSEVRNAPIDPTGLTIEVTETAAIVNIERARMLAQSLADLGCHFALDDFGSGFGSFYYLKHLPFDIVKIDGEFIKELENSHTDRLTVQAIVQIARGLGKPTIAECVESEPRCDCSRARRGLRAGLPHRAPAARLPDPGLPRHELGGAISKPLRRDAILVVEADGVTSSPTSGREAVRLSSGALVARRRLARAEHRFRRGPHRRDG